MGVIDERLRQCLRRPSVMLGLVMLILGGLLALLWSWGETGTSSLRFACAAGLREPVTEIAAAFEKETGLSVEIRLGGSGELAGQLELAKSDLFLPADEVYLQPLRQNGRLREVFRLVVLQPGLVVAKGNPLGLKRLEDLRGNDVRLSLADRSAAIGQVSWRFLEESARLEEFTRRVVVTRPTVNGVVEDVACGAVDATLAWDRVAANFGEVEWLPLDGLSERQKMASVAVMASGDRQEAALRFARYLADPQKGGQVFSRMGFHLAEGEVPSHRAE